jgi:uncharacterized protein
VKYALFLTHRCNLACAYCYVSKSSDRMPLSIANTAVDFAFRHTPPSDPIDIGFFGGEPLLAFPMIETITRNVRSRPDFDPCRVHIGLATNGTLLTGEILDFLAENEIQTTISCDGPPDVHDRFRVYADGRPTSAQVERAIRMAVGRLRYAPVNAVYRPETLARLPETIDYLSSLGVRHIYLNPDYSARWTQADIDRVPEIYGAVAERYKRYYRQNEAHYISLIDVKITVILRGGYQPSEHCGMGEREFAFTASGRVLPCERLASSQPELHAIGSANGADGIVQIGPLQDHFAPGPPGHSACAACSIQSYCANWCGCSNYMMSGAYNRVSPFLCASERTSIRLAFDAFRELESELGPTFMDHLGGMGQSRSVWDISAAAR